MVLQCCWGVVAVLLKGCWRVAECCWKKFERIRVLTKCDGVCW